MATWRNRQWCRGHLKAAMKVWVWVCRGRGRDMATVKISHLKVATKVCVWVYRGRGMAAAKRGHLKAAMKVPWGFSGAGAWPLQNLDLQCTKPSATEAILSFVGYCPF